MKKLRIGLIGAGAIGKVHLEGFKYNDKCEIIAIASRTEEHAKNFAELFNIPKIYTDWKKMIKDEDLDVISICSPNYLHYPMIMESLKKDLHILCEKPLCITQKELVDVENELNKRKIIFFTAFHKRYISIFPLIRDIIREGILGKISLATHFFSHLGPYISHNALSKEKWFFGSEKTGGGVWGFRVGLP